jgi:ATP-dependent helicase/nuclease subunit A
VGKERLRAIGRSLLLELDRPARGAEPTELDALMATVDAVRASALWRRAEAAKRRLAEVPFALELEDATWMEGVVDLAFRESDGWVLVDYKTDRGDDPDFAARRLSYREQLTRYADAWSRLTGEPVKERLIFWTRQRKEERVE